MHEGVERALAEARALGFLGPGPLDQHERSAQAFLDALGTPPEGARVLDLGSGGGVPGLLLAAAWPATSWVLLDNHRRRTSFLANMVAVLGWGARVQVVRAAAEVAGHEPEHREQYDLVVSRSFGPPPATAECAAAFLRRDGRMAVAEPPADAAADRWPEGPLRELGLHQEQRGAVAVFRRIGDLPPDVARPWKTMERRPRW